VNSSEVRYDPWMNSWRDALTTHLPHIAGSTPDTLTGVPALRLGSPMATAVASNAALPSWLAAKGGAHGDVPRRALVTIGLAIGIAMAAAYLLGWGVGDLLPLSASSFIATYVLSMAAAIRLLHGLARVGAAIALVACVVVLLFSGALLAWIVGVAIACVLYTRTRFTGPQDAG